MGSMIGLFLPNGDAEIRANVKDRRFLVYCAAAQVADRMGCFVRTLDGALRGPHLDQFTLQMIIGGPRDQLESILSQVNRGNLFTPLGHDPRFRSTGRTPPADSPFHLHVNVRTPDQPGLAHGLARAATMCGGVLHVIRARTTNGGDKWDHPQFLIRSNIVTGSLKDQRDTMESLHAWQTMAEVEFMSLHRLNDEDPSLMPSATRPAMPNPLTARAHAEGNSTEIVTSSRYPPPPQTAQHLMPVETKPSPRISVPAIPEIFY